MKNKLLSLLTFRFRQCIRQLKTVGWGLGLVFIFAAAGLVFSMLKFIISIESAYSIAFSGVILLSVDYYRKDKMFLFSIFRNKINLILYLAMEYLLLVFPIAVFQIILQNYVYGAAVILTAILMALISPEILIKDTTVKKSSMDFLSTEYFELKFSLERFKGFWIVFWFFGFLGFFHIAFYVVWIFFIIISMGESFKYYESREMVHWEDRFVFKKFRRYSLLMFQLICLQTMVTLMMHLDYYHFILYMFVCAYVALLLNISVKYSLYNPVNRFHYGQNSVAIFTIISLLPGGIIISLIYSILKYFKAEGNLKYYYA
ncbi:MAG: hypothetical protein RIR48_3076 [Bacteroidota bacterium]